MSEKDAYEEAFQFALVHSKMFVVKFSKNPWPASKPPQGSRNTIDLIRRRPNDMTLWTCSKDRMITCSFAGEEKP